MAVNETEAARWTRRAGDAATEAILAGADPAAILAAVEAGIREGRRVQNLRRGVAPEPASAPVQGPLNAPKGSAIEAMLRAVGNAA